MVDLLRKYLGFVAAVVSTLLVTAGAAQAVQERFASFSGSDLQITAAARATVPWVGCPAETQDDDGALTEEVEEPDTERDGHDGPAPEWRPCPRGAGLWCVRAYEAQRERSASSIGDRLVPNGWHPRALGARGPPAD